VFELSSHVTVGRVIGTKAAQPLDFWIAVDPEGFVQLDEVIAVTTKLPVALPDGREHVEHFGVIDAVESAYEGASFHSDVFRDAQGTLPVAVSTIAHVSVTRVEPEVLVPPAPGEAVRRATSADRDLALYFDRMEQRFPAGLGRDGEPVYGNLEFLDGTRGAHVNISGISGVATKTSYAMFLLYGLFHSDALPNAAATHCIVFNVKGEDLLWLDKQNSRITDEARERYAKLDLPVGAFTSVGLWAPPTVGMEVIPNCARQDGVEAYYWTLREFCSQRMLRFLFTETDDETSQINFAVSQVERYLERQMEGQSPDTGEVVLQAGTSPDIRVDSFGALVDFIDSYINDIAERATDATRGAFIRRLLQSREEIGPLVRGVRDQDAERHRFDWKARQVSVIDINKLRDRGKRFVVGVVMRRLMEDRENQSGDPNAAPVFLVLDELNKYAPRQGRSPIKDVLLDIAERGRSLKVVLIGAQQTASEIERRVTANSSFRIVGRLDSAESHRDEYGYLTASAKLRSSLLKPGSMFIQQPDVPVPILIEFPFPCWATRAAEAIGRLDQGMVLADRFS